MKKLNEAQSVATMLNLRPNFLHSQRKLLDEEVQHSYSEIKMTTTFVRYRLPKHHFCEAHKNSVSVQSDSYPRWQHASPKEGCAIYHKDTSCFSRKTMSRERMLLDRTKAKMVLGLSFTDPLQGLYTLWLFYCTELVKKLSRSCEASFFTSHPSLTKEN